MMVRADSARASDDLVDASAAATPIPRSASTSTDGFVTLTPCCRTTKRTGCRPSATAADDQGAFVHELDDRVGQEWLPHALERWLRT
jgi:hypothetical protein